MTDMTLREKIAREIVVMIGFEDDPDAPPGPLTYEWTDRILALIQEAHEIVPAGTKSKIIAVAADIHRAKWAYDGDKPRDRKVFELLDRLGMQALAAAPKVTP